MVVRRVNPLSCAKIAGVLYAIMGLLVGAFASLVGLAGALAIPADAGAGAGLFGALFGVGAVVMLPIVYGCLGFVSTLIGAVLYNVIAGMVGGVEIDVA